MKIIRRRAIYSLWTLVFALVGEATANNPPQVALVEATPFVDETTTLTYVLYDEDDDTDGSLKYELYAYPDNGLKSVADIRTFALLLADQRDITQEVGTGDFVESEGPLGTSLFHFVDFGQLIFMPGTADFFEGTADFTLPSDGQYIFFIRGVPWLDPFTPGDYGVSPLFIVGAPPSL